MIKATVNVPRIGISPLSIPKLSKTGLMKEIKGTDYKLVPNHIENDSVNSRNNGYTTPSPRSPHPIVIAKLYEIMDAVADRVEMHKSIGEQRDNWNHLLLTSVNGITLTAATMCGIGAANATGSPISALQISSTMLYLAATGMLCIINKIQPSQLAEEQRNAARLFKQLHEKIHTLLTIGNPTTSDVNEAIESVLALDKAYPLPLLGSMIEKFPSQVKPAVWWPQQKRKNAKPVGVKTENNGWSAELEDEMRQILEVLKQKDEADYLTLSKKALQFSKMLAISGPVLTFLGAMGSAFVGTNVNTTAVMIGVGAGALASIANALEHGGQVGMVFEMYRSNAGFFKLMEETIESNINERNVWRRENGEVFKTKVALQLGRSLSDLKRLAKSSKYNAEEFASKLF